MQITEFDIFKFVYYPQELEADKFEYISKNSDLFNAEIEFLTETKKSLASEVDPEILAKLMNKINAANNSKIIHLSKTQNIEDIQEEQIVLAAASPKLKKTFQSETFVDDKSKYMIKMLSNERFNKLFVLEKDNNELRNIELIVYPSGESFKLKTNLDPLIIEPRQNIEDISLISCEEYK